MIEAANILNKKVLHSAKLKFTYVRPSGTFFSSEAAASRLETLFLATRSLALTPTSGDTLGRSFRPRI